MCVCVCLCRNCWRDSVSISWATSYYRRKPDWNHSLQRRFELSFFLLFLSLFLFPTVDCKHSVIDKSNKPVHIVNGSLPVHFGVQRMARFPQRTQHFSIAISRYAPPHSTVIGWPFLGLGLPIALALYGAEGAY